MLIIAKCRVFLDYTDLRLPPRSPYQIDACKAMYTLPRLLLLSLLQSENGFSRGVRLSIYYNC